MTNQANWDRAKEMYPSTTNLTTKDWVAFFDRNPDAMHQILGDIFVITKAAQATVKKSGRRPRHVNGSLDELYTMITPRYATVPFGDAMNDLIGESSIRKFAAKIPMHYWSLIRLMKGERQIINPYDVESSMITLEMIAKAGGVAPSYFLEYRTLYIMKVFRDVFAAKPNATIGLMNKLRDLEEA